MENALALGADEGRDKLRKATGRSKYPAIRGYPNVGTHMVKNHETLSEQNRVTWGTPGTETSKYREEEKSEGSFEEVQAKKSTRRMPWHWEPTKDATSCEKPRGGANSRYIRGCPNGETSHAHRENVW